MTEETVSEDVREFLREADELYSRSQTTYDKARTVLRQGDLDRYVELIAVGFGQRRQAIQLREMANKRRKEGAK